MNYRIEIPENYKQLTSDGIVSYFESDEATKDEVAWFKSVLASDEYKIDNKITPYNWLKIKKAFAKKFLPEIAPAEEERKIVSMNDRLAKFM